MILDRISRFLRLRDQGILIDVPRFFRTLRMLMFLLIVLLIGVNVRLLVGYFLSDLANAAAGKVLLLGSDSHVRDSIGWYVQSQSWLPDVTGNAPIILASLYTTDCNHETDSLLQSVVASDPVWFALQGRCSWLGGKRDSAIQIWQQGRLAPYLYNLAVWDQTRGYVDRGLEEYTTLLAVDPSSVEGWLGLGSLYEKLKNWSQAEFAYEEAIRLAPDNPLTHQVMAWYRWGLALESNRTESEILMAIQLASVSSSDSRQTISPRMDASKLYMRVRTASLDLPNLYTRLAGLYVWSGRPYLAEEASQMAITLDPKLAWAYHFLGDALQMQGRNPEAIAVYKKALLIGKTNNWLHYGLAKAYMETGDLINAMREAQYLVTIDPHEAMFYSLLDEIQKHRDGDCPCPPTSAP